LKLENCDSNLELSEFKLENSNSKLKPSNSKLENSDTKLELSNLKLELSDMKPEEKKATFRFTFYNYSITSTIQLSQLGIEIPPNQ